MTGGTGMHLKGTVSRDFLLQVFFMNHLPPSPKNNIREVISNFFENSQRYSQVKLHHRYQRHGVKCATCTAGVVDMGANNWNNIRLFILKVNLKKKNYLYVNSTTTQRCPN
jgi:hypothetical protein